MPHLCVDISAHGYGHLAQAAPVLNRLAELLPALRLTVCSALPLSRLRERIQLPFTHIAAASDFGYVMINALHIDHAASAAAYRAVHADFPQRVTAAAARLRELRADAVCSAVAYLPLAAAAQLGIPAATLCSLNWADLFAHYYGDADWAAPIHAEMLAAYRSADFLRTTPGMSMPALQRRIDIGVIATAGQERRSALLSKVGAGSTAHTQRLVLVALGGIPTRLPIADWPTLPDTHWLVPAGWQPRRPGFHAIEALEMPFTDLLRSVDAVITKPGYGTFAEAVCNGAAVLYQRRDDWPEQDCLIDWLHRHGRGVEVAATDLMTGNLETALRTAQQLAVPPAPTFAGAERAAQHLAGLLR